MPDPATIAAIVGTFLLAGTVKGVVGLGLPTVSLGLLTLIFDLPTALVLLLAPSLVTNVWQAVSGGHLREVIARIWPFLLASFPTIWIGAALLARADVHLLTILLGGLLALYAAINLVGFRPSMTPETERWLGPPLGAVNGVLAGMTGSFVIPGVLFLQALGFSRHALVQAMGLLFAVSTFGLALALGTQRMLPPELGLMSLIGLVPALIGMVIGRAIRDRISEPVFRRLFFVAILALGAGLALRTLL